MVIRVLVNMDEREVIDIGFTYDSKAIMTQWTQVLYAVALLLTVFRFIDMLKYWPGVGMLDEDMNPGAAGRR
jgi:phosphatidylglycerophosphatase A